MAIGGRPHSLLHSKDTYDIKHRMHILRFPKKNAWTIINKTNLIQGNIGN